ncbi:MAG: tetratricopeptide repeat protein [Dehalococcoidia bacterium]
MTDFRFAKAVSEEHLVRSGRVCCLCEQQAGARVEIHHIVPKAKGGTKDFENAIVLCFQCHADVHAYAERSPKGRKYSPTELRRRRDAWYEKFEQRRPEVDYKSLAGELLEQFAQRTPAPQGAADLGTEELAREAGPNTEALLQEALDLQAQHKEREAIDALFEAFRRDLEPMAKAQLHNLLGISFYYLSEPEEAEAHYRQALEASRVAGDKTFEGAVLDNIGLVLRDRGDFVHAKDYHRDALEIHRHAGFGEGEANDLNNLGVIYRHFGNLGRAERYHRDALDLSRDLGYAKGEADSLSGLGLISRERNLLEQAKEQLLAALAIHRKSGSKPGEAQDLGNLGNAFAASGDYKRAEKYYRDSLSVDRVIGYRAGEARQLGNIGNLLFRQGKLDQVGKYYSDALAIQREIGDRLGEASVLINVGLLAAANKEDEEACRSMREAAAILQALGLTGTELETARRKLAELGCDEKPADGRRLTADG